MHNKSVANAPLRMRFLVVLIIERKFQFLCYDVFTWFNFGLNCIVKNYFCLTCEILMDFMYFRDLLLFGLYYTTTSRV
jgi:hypothetical protein